MTTITVKNNIMVSDGQMSRGDFIDSYDFEKIVNINGCLVGCAGSVASILKFRQWFADNMEAELAKQDYPFVNISLPDDMIEDDFTALVLYPDGVLYEFFGAGSAMEVKQPAAIGSGMFYALSAMDAGASAEEAVKIATLRDAYSGGDIQVFELEEMEEGLTEEKFDEMSKEDLKKLLFGVSEGSCEEGDTSEEVPHPTDSPIIQQWVSEDGVYDLTLFKDGTLDDDSGLQGFSKFMDVYEEMDRGRLKSYSNLLGVKYAHNISDEKLAQRLDDKVKEIVDNINQ